MELSIEPEACKYLFKSKTQFYLKKKLMTRYDDSIFMLICRVSHRIPLWVLQGINMYYTEARTQLKRSIMNHVVQLAFRETKKLVTTQLFIVKSIGNAVFWVAPLVDQFKLQVYRSINFFNFFQRQLFIKIETDVESHLIFFIF